MVQKRRMQYGNSKNPRSIETLYIYIYIDTATKQENAEPNDDFW
jgi:hypothetical protein